MKPSSLPDFCTHRLRGKVRDDERTFDLTLGEYRVGSSAATS